jgi:alpha-ketoglutaric semialdehyde dehydrogenase
MQRRHLLARPDDAPSRLTTSATATNTEQEQYMSESADDTTRCSYVAGKWASDGDGEIHNAVDPGRRGEVVARYRTATPALVDAAVRAAADAQAGWAVIPGGDRGELVHGLIDRWRGRIDELAESVTREMGKPLSESRGEATRAIGEMRFWAGEALRIGDRTFPSARQTTDVRTIRQPIGPVAAITPWNFPILSPVRKVVPALVSGCPVVLKPAMQAPGASVLLAEMLDELGLPDGVFNLVLGSGSDVGSALTAHPGIAGLTFTGSTDVGLRLAERTAARNVKLQLEMGGKNAAVVASYADVEHAAAEITTAAYTTSGQRCTAISRVIVIEAQRAALEQALVRRVEALRVGHGMAEDTQMGPLASGDQFETVRHHVEAARRDGARVLTGGRALHGDGVEDGYYYAPTLITDVARGSDLATEEVFGPVLAVIPVATFEEALEVNNETRYGLTASIFTDDMDFAHRFITGSQTGMVHVNHGTISEGHVPFGGVKQSGQGAYAIGDTAREFYTAPKAVYQVHRR